MRAVLPALLLLVSCGKSADDTGVVVSISDAGCGDGVVDAGEQCDDGDANSDTEPDACRSTCVLPTCGDEVVDQGEDCDDGAFIGGDGCSPGCLAEEGQLEDEPNDRMGNANAWEEGETIFGNIEAEGDIDCFTVELADCEAISAQIQEPCPDPVTLRLHDPDGDEVAVGTPTPGSCAALDPMEHEGARYVTDGTWAVCVEGVLEREVPGYALDLAVTAVGDGDFPQDQADDLDDDGLPNRCDDDIDGDGVLNDEDNCPEVANNGEIELSVDSNGYIRTWLAIGPFTGHSSPEGCLPSAEQLVAEDDSQVTPSVGDAVVIPAEDTGSADESLSWWVLSSGDARINFLEDFGDVDAPREVYLAVYVYSEEARSLTLALGPDDGAYAWVGGVEALAITGCQGTNADQFQAEVELAEGWTPLVLKVYDQGGGWGTFARFLDGPDGAPITDLQLSLSPDGPWVDEQSDSDGDGEGDVCDETPNG